jgi:malonyl-CoA/methylmalonyl-CoA synthetase
MHNLIKQAEKNHDRSAIRQEDRVWSYEDLLTSSTQVGIALAGGYVDLNEKRVAFMVHPGFDYVRVQWGIWRAGGIAVPLCLDYPLPSLQYVVDDTQAEIIVCSTLFLSIIHQLKLKESVRIIEVEMINHNTDVSGKDFFLIESRRRAMILYTSGTTSLPKGVVITHANLEAQITTLVTAWKWSNSDHILCVLPLHHVHGIVNVVCCSLWAGACCEFLPGPFSSESVFKVFLKQKVNVFMAVPTIYYKLIAHWEKLKEEQQQKISERLEKFRLMVSGSAALPVSVMEKWKSISNHWLLERYGMTEMGMAISNPYEGFRKPGHIGFPLPGVEVRLCDEKDAIVSENEPGEIQVKGANVFSGYWSRKEATEKAFTRDGWFRTGDVAEVINGYYKILGRNSVDIIKSGGYKISALEIEEVLRTHSQIKDCSVVGVDNEEWGEVVAAAIVSDDLIKFDELTHWINERMPRYKTPRLFRQVIELPRNTMGKVVKGELKKMFTS